ncbi:MAG: preprotein translocase subunit SecE [Clostridia bacterium]|nr:preprotein translocase subunit SecE [Clostridia bacterium]
MNKFSKLIALLCAILLMISLFAVPAFATDTGSSDGGVTDGGSTGEGSDEFDDETGSDSGSTDEGEGSGEGEGEGEDDGEGEGETPAPAEEKKLTKAQIIWIAVGGGALLIAIVLCIVFRAKLVKGLRVYKSEFKKVSWLSWEQTRKSTLVVLVVLIVCALVICLMDFGLGKGIRWLILEAFKAPTGN